MCTTETGRRRLALLLERTSTNVAQAPCDHGLRVEIDDEQCFLEPRRPRDHLALVVEHHGVAVEDQLVLAADRVAQRDEARVVARAGNQHLLALAVLVEVERRRRDVQQQLRTGEGEVGRGRSRLPDVLADRHTRERLAVLEQEQVAPLSEVARLIEDAVVRQEALAVDGFHLAARAHRARVEEVAVVVRVADERGDPARFEREPVERLGGCPDEAGPEEQILGRVAGDRELGKEEQLDALALRLGDPRGHLLAVAVEVADDRVDLCESEPQGFSLTVENLVYLWWSSSSPPATTARPAPQTAVIRAVCSPSRSESRPR